MRQVGAGAAAADAAAMLCDRRQRAQRRRRLPLRISPLPAAQRRGQPRRQVRPLRWRRMQPNVVHLQGETEYHSQHARGQGTPQMSMCMTSTA